MSIRIVYNDGHSEEGEHHYGEALHNALFVAPRNIDWGRTVIDGVRLDGPPLAIAKRGYVFYLLKLESGRAMVAAGCRYMSIPEYRAHVAREYPGTDKATRTLRILDFFEALARDAQCTGLGDESEQSAEAQTPPENNRRCPRCAGPTLLYNSGGATWIHCQANNVCLWGYPPTLISLADFDAQQHIRPANPAPPPPLGPYDTEKARAMRQERPGYHIPDLACPGCGGMLYVHETPGSHIICSDFNRNSVTCPFRGAASADEVRAMWDRKRVAEAQPQQAGLADIVAPPASTPKQPAIPLDDAAKAFGNLIHPAPPRTLQADIMELLNSNPKIERISNRLDNMQRLIERLCAHLGVR